MKKLTYVAFHGKSWTSKLVKFWTRSRYSHVAVALPAENGLGLLIEAWSHKSKFKLYWDYSTWSRHRKGTKYEMWTLMVDEGVYDKCMTAYTGYAIRKLPYDWTAIFGFFLKHKNESKKGKHCSEGCFTPLASALHILHIRPSQVSPQSFIELISAMGAKRTSRGEVL